MGSASSNRDRGGPKVHCPASTSAFSQLFIPGQRDSLLVLYRLASSGLFRPYIIYNRGSEHLFAGGILAEVTVDSAGVHWESHGAHSSEPLGASPFRQVGSLLGGLDIGRWRAYGYIAFEMAYLNGCGHPRVGDGQPVLHLIVPQTEVRLTPTGILIRCVDAAMLRKVWELITDLGCLPEYRATPVAVDVADDHFQDGVKEVVGAIAQRRVQKVILSRRVDVPFELDLFGTYVLGLRRIAAERSFMLDMRDRCVVGFSPETVVETRPDGLVSSHPLAGTRPCVAEEEANERLRQDLLWDVKEGYEHLISVKLAHEEMQSVCRPGSVGVRDLMTVKRRGSVQHLASQVTGRLAADRTVWDVAEALFPAVTASGIPKREAYRYIAGIETGERGLYAGVVGIVDSVGLMDASLVLRSVFQEDGRAWLQAGAGIVACSDPGDEFRETCHKLQGLAKCLAAA